MVVDPKDIVSFLSWLPWAALHWLLVVACVAAGVTVIGWLVSAVRHGPGAATRTTTGVLSNAAVDLTHISPLRVWALARLAIQESIRRRVVVVFATPPLWLLRQMVCMLPPFLL